MKEILLQVTTELFTLLDQSINRNSDTLWEWALKMIRRCLRHENGYNLHQSLEYTKLLSYLISHACHLLRDNLSISNKQIEIIGSLLNLEMDFIQFSSVKRLRLDLMLQWVKKARQFAPHLLSQLAVQMK